MYSLFRSIDGEAIAILELCDGHFVNEWAKVKSKMNIEEFKEFLSMQPNSDVAVDLMDLYISMYGSELTVKDLFFT